MTPEPRLTMTARELWEALGISRSRYHDLKAIGEFRHLESPIPHRYSRARVVAWINGTATQRRPWAKAS
jgi:hypothetical protein